MAVNFDGTNDYFTFPDSPSTVNISPGTWSFWANVARATTTPRVWGKGAGAGKTIGVQFSAAQTAFQFNARFSLGDLNLRSSPNSLVLNKWNHWAVTWDGTNLTSGVKMYLNTVETTYVDGTNGVEIAPNDSGIAGAVGASNAAANDFNGQIMHLQVWRRILSVDEIRQSMYLPGSVSEDLVQHYPLDYARPVMSDYSKYGNNGTSAGITTVLNSNAGVTSQWVVPEASFCAV